MTKEYNLESELADYCRKPILVRACAPFRVLSVYWFGSCMISLIVSSFNVSLGIGM